MSIILDALKKLEDKRRNEAAPDLMTVHVMEREGWKRPLPVFLLIALLLLNAVILTVWLIQDRQDNDPVRTAQAASENVITAQAATPIEPALEPALHHEQKVVETAPDPAASEEIVPEAETPPISLTPSTEELTTLKDTIAKEQLAARAGPASIPDLDQEMITDADRTLPDMSSLPLSVREGLPDLEIKGHIYSNETMSRVVNINGNILREGEAVTQGLIVDTITMSGVVFDYNGLRFSVRAF